MQIQLITSSLGWAVFRAIVFVTLAIGFGLALVPVIA